MTADEARRLASLARRLGVGADAVVLAAATMAENPELRAADVLARLRDARPDASPTGTTILAMLRTSPPASAPAHVEDAFATLWGRASGAAP